jgi:multiple sugar transport system ATP-binding protein
LPPLATKEEIETPMDYCENWVMAAVTLSHLSKTFSGPVRAVDDLCLDIGEQELLVLMGPSGCGKTTTLRLIAGLETATSGRILFDGRDVVGLPPRKRNVAMVFQQGALYPHFSVRGNLGFGLKMRGMKKDEIAPRVNEAAVALAIADLLNRRPSDLSYGQQQRVALGRAMADRPQLFLLDEPLASLDVPLRRQLRQEIRRLHQRSGVPMIYVTHDPAEAMALGQRIAILRDGRLQQAADPQTLYDRPANRFVASMCGNPGMNFLDGYVEVADGKCSLVLGEDVVLTIPDCSLALAPFSGRRVTLGVRPEHIRLNSEYSVPSTQCWLAIPTTIEAVEVLGAETHVYLTTGMISLNAWTEGNVRPIVGERIVATVEPEHLRLFDAETEAAL